MDVLRYVVLTPQTPQIYITVQTHGIAKRHTNEVTGSSQSIQQSLQKLNGVKCHTVQCVMCLIILTLTQAFS